MSASLTPSSPCANLCPLCGQTNACAQAQGGSADSPCWCSTVRFSPTLLARVPEAQRGVSCICEACARAAAQTE
ncbi:MAG: cysteine-rich CWC family protein [Aquabacterium sp.]|uniref:cysteine-rich CWC family protein n=1 Tax=Aquabacterium sp. TaxID=1872578 RepID=UPI001B47D88F|nr:cysteine-rich CWC family protein [Aquabacterium sp.]MBP7131184.1 cysteine-rich CWC family protein [Aquabacterium sp.]MBP9063178.1 cysteine-rich CWC family protein [Aquabacterium sp.]